MYKRIMVVVDDKPSSHVAVEEGTALAAAHDAEVVFLGTLAQYSVPVAEAGPFVAVAPEAFLQAARARTEELLADAMAAAEKAGVMAHAITGDEGDGAHGVVEAAQRRRCDLIVVASEGRNAVVRLLTGSVIPGLITSSPVPVLVCKEPRHPRPDAAVAATHPSGHHDSAGDAPWARLQ